MSLTYVYATDIFYPIDISVNKVKQDSYAIHYTSEGNVRLVVCYSGHREPKSIVFPLNLREFHSLI